jgi:hypothetical protein
MAYYMFPLVSFNRSPLCCSPQLGSDPAQLGAAEMLKAIRSFCADGLLVTGMHALNLSSERERKKQEVYVYKKV